MPLFNNFNTKCWLYSIKLTMCCQCFHHPIRCSILVTLYIHSKVVIFYVNLSSIYMRFLFKKKYEETTRQSETLPYFLAGLFLALQNLMHLLTLRLILMHCCIVESLFLCEVIYMSLNQLSNIVAMVPKLSSLHAFLCAYRSLLENLLSFDLNRETLHHSNIFYDQSKTQNLKFKNNKKKTKL